MRIAFAHNLQRNHSEREAEFDTPETVAAIAEALRRLGHEVQPVEVSSSLSWLAARLQSLSPDLIFNTAEGDDGRFREAFFPALYEKLGLPFTGSDAHVCALTMDKRLAKNLVAAQGVPTSDSWFVDRGDGLDEVEQFPFPLIVKPNFEGSSKGIGTDSVVEDRPSLNGRVEQMLARFPEGVLVERFIPGRDLTVPFLEKASPGTGGVLEPACYEYDSRFASPSKYNLYDLERKTTAASAVRVMVPAPITPGQRARCLEFALKVFRILGLRDLGRADFRLGDDGEIYFLEVNALPSLEPGASIYLSAVMAGLSSVDAVLEAVVRSAAARHGLPFCARPARPKAQELRVGLAFNLRRADALTAEQDGEAEYDSPQTVAAIREALESYGHTVVELEATAELPATVAAAGVDVVFNIAEGIGGRYREAQVPALLELLGIPYTGSDPTAMSLTLDKQLAKLVVKQAGCRTPAHMVMRSCRERLAAGLEFPLIVKPLAQGSSMGIGSMSIAETEAELRRIAREIVARYGQAALVESFLPGREFTLALLGERRPRVLPPMEILFTNPDCSHPIYDFSAKFEGNGIGYAVPAPVEPGLGRELERVAHRAFDVLGCRDLARIDLRLDRQGQVNFIECNPLPGLAPGFSDLCLITERSGISYRDLIGEILAPCIRRRRRKQKANVTANPG